jgi:hypothetical protein
MHGRFWLRDGVDIVGSLGRVFYRARAGGGVTVSGDGVLGLFGFGGRSGGLAGLEERLGVELFGGGDGGRGVDSARCQLFGRATSPGGGR